MSPSLVKFVFCVIRCSSFTCTKRKEIYFMYCEYVSLRFVLDWA